MRPECALDNELSGANPVLDNWGLARLPSGEGLISPYPEEDKMNNNKKYTVETVNPMIHTMKSGEQVVMTCKHPVKFADGSVFPGQENPPELKVEKIVSVDLPIRVAGMPVRISSLRLSEETLSEINDLVSIGLPVLVSAYLRDAILALSDWSEIPGEWYNSLFVMGQTPSPRGEGKSEQVCSWLELVFGSSR